MFCTILIVLCLLCGSNSQLTVLIKPKIVVINYFNPEGLAWYHNSKFNLLEQNVSVPGLAPPIKGVTPIFGDIHCTENGEICQLVTGRAEINTALSVMAFTMSTKFDLTESYFLLAGIGGISPYSGTIGSVTFARYAVQADMQYEIDAREIPKNFSTGFFASGSYGPGQFPQSLYGTEVFELNDNLRRLAATFGQNAVLCDTLLAQETRARYSGLLGAGQPSIVLTDTVTTNQFWSGSLLAESMSNYTQLLTNGSATYGTSQQNDNAALEALLRSAALSRTDFGRIILMRSASNFDRPSKNETILQNLLYEQSGALESSLQNMVSVGVEIIGNILVNWDTIFEKGIQADNYIGDIMGTLGGIPDFG